MEGQGVIILAVVAASVLLPLAFIAYIDAGDSYRAIHNFLGARKANKRGGKTSSSFTCSIDTDCPPEYVCVNGHCVPMRS